MILHFLKWDFKMFRTQWIILSIAVIGSLFLRVEESILFVAFFVFMLLPISKLVGSKFRTQHEMSRNYLLSLPVSRMKMFLILIGRLAMFATPFFLFLIVDPNRIVNWLMLSKSWFPEFTTWRLLTPFGLLWLISTSAHMQITMETMSSYQQILKRFLVYCQNFIVMLVELFLVLYFFFTATSVLNPEVGLRILCAFGLVVLCFFRTGLTARRWIKA
jgi:hypothetical protein